MKILINDWLFSMGAVALLRLDKNKVIEVQGNMMNIPTSFWETFSQDFFDYLIEHYSLADKQKEKIMRYMKSLVANIQEKPTSKQKEASKRYSSWIQNSFKETQKKVEKYFDEEAQQAKELLDELAQALKENNVVDIQKAVEGLCAVYGSKEVNKKLTLNYVKAMILGKSGGQVSFLNVTKNALTFEEQVALFEQDFIAPLVFEWQLKEAIENQHENQQEETVQEILQSSEEKIVKSYRTAHKKSKDIDFAWFEQYPECSAIDGEWAAVPFEEKLFMPLGSTALNDRWDLNNKHMQYVGYMARLLLFLAPVGCSSYKRKFGREETFVFSFLHIEGDCLETFHKNNDFLEILTNKKLFSDALIGNYKHLEYQENQRHKVTVLIDWITFGSETKKTLLEYRMINENFIKKILNNKKINISKIHPYEFREELVQQGLRGQDSKSLIIEEMHQQLTTSFELRSMYSVKQALKMREYLMKGDEKMTNEQKTLTDSMYVTGAAIKKKLLGNDKTAEAENYSAPQEKKIVGIIYRLLNATKGGNRQQFFDTAIRLHVLTGHFISKEFTSMLDKKEVSDKEFATMALAFIAGLTPSVEKNKESKEDESNG